jgi:hypothetical protein
MFIEPWSADNSLITHSLGYKEAFSGEVLAVDMHISDSLVYDRL